MNAKINKFINQANIIHNSKYTYDIASFINMTTKINMECPIHGTFQQRPSNHIHSKQGCPACVGRGKTTDMFIIEANQKHHNKFNYDKTEYHKAHVKVIISCPIHGDFLQRPNDHLMGYGCNKCRPNNSIGTEEFIRRSQHIHGNKHYDYTNTVYTNRTTKVQIKCNRHGSFFQKPEAHLAGCGCPRCQLSKGEAFISTCLERMNVEFINQYSFIDCISDNNRPLRFDFFLPQFNTLIEYDGKQHFYPAIKVFSDTHTDEIATQKLEYQQKVDEYKNQYAISKNIQLIRIAYWDFKNIEQILKNHLSV